MKKMHRQQEQLAKRIEALEAECREASSELQKAEMENAAISERERADKSSLGGRPSESASETLWACAVTGKGKDKRGAGGKGPKRLKG